MTDLFNPIERTAVISLCKDYRYELRRIWNRDLPLLVVCMLNPSRADAFVDDPTISTLTHFARFWGYGGLLVVNLYAYRTSKPAELFAFEGHRAGPENEAYTAAAVRYAHANGGRMLAAWGNDGADRAQFFCEWVAAQGVELICLGTTQSGAPKHPMARGVHRIPRNQRPILWKAAA